MSKAQIIKCKCGSIVAACSVPLCYEDKDWLKDLPKFSKKGYSIDVIEVDNSWTIERCKCKDKEQNLFGNEQK
jgi:hypothetical protein